MSTTPSQATPSQATPSHASLPLDTVLDRAAAAGVRARAVPPAERARLLTAVADALDAAAGTLVPVAHRESHLPEARLTGELARTTFQCRLFAERLASGALDDVRVDHADPDWPMGARPDIRRTTVPLGPVLVFAASNFPFAFSVAGGDTVSALAAGCPVVVKAHPGHPELSRLTASVASAALDDAGAPAHLLQLIEGEREGADAVQDHRVKAVGFTGSTRGGRYLFQLAADRPDPIPFYGELGSTNPVVVTPAGWAERGTDIATGFAASFTLGSGQFCTQPGVVFVPDVDAFVGALPPLTAGPMLDDRIAGAYADGLDQLAAHGRVCTARRIGGGESLPDIALLRTTTDAVREDPSLISTEVFGPASLLVEYGSLDEVEAVLAGFGGTLTGTVQGGHRLDEDGRRLLDALAGHAGRVIWNEWPTGVTVSDAQQHGGPWPASTAPTTTSVGTAAVNRFRRPVAYQNVPRQALPPEIRDR
ncbi:aldehyde dehydrogenase (NADP(+)) [Streptomyces olivaceus]|uniref:aldehyde dehydrogenase (NADP(+)) n=1 Tax=Streptomyces olivaceus TaxID=47716 RepID=UPI00363FC8DA